MRPEYEKKLDGSFGLLPPTVSYKYHDIYIAYIKEIVSTFPNAVLDELVWRSNSPCMAYKAFLSRWTIGRTTLSFYVEKKQLNPYETSPVKCFNTIIIYVGKELYTLEIICIDSLQKNRKPSIKRIIQAIRGAVNKHEKYIAWIEDNLDMYHKIGEIPVC